MSAATLNLARIATSMKRLISSMTVAGQVVPTSMSVRHRRTKKISSAKRHETAPSKYEMWLSLASFALIFLCVAVVGAQATILPDEIAAPLFTSSAKSQSQDITQAQADLYERWRANIRNNQTLAYEAGKEYLTKYPEDGYTAHVKKWVGEYEKAARRVRFRQLLERDKKYGEAFATGKLVLADAPDNLQTLINLAYAGYFAQAENDSSVNAETLAFARQAIERLGAGDKLADWKPFANQADALGYLNFIAGELTLKDSPLEASRYFLEALRHEGSVKTYPVIYARLGVVYAVRDFDPLARKFEARYKGKDVTPESQVALAEVYQVVDKIVDAYARAVALSGTDAQYEVARRRWLEELNRFYKTRHNNSLDGLETLIANVLTKPLP